MGVIILFCLQMCPIMDHMQLFWLQHGFRPEVSKSERNFKTFWTGRELSKPWYLNFVKEKTVHVKTPYGKPSLMSRLFSIFR